MRHPCIIYPKSGRDLASRSWERHNFSLVHWSKMGVKIKVMDLSASPQEKGKHTACTTKGKRSERSQMAEVWTDSQYKTDWCEMRKWKAKKHTRLCCGAFCTRLNVNVQKKRDRKKGVTGGLGGTDGRSPFGLQSRDSWEFTGFRHKTTNTRRRIVGKIFFFLKAEGEKQSFLLLPL